MKEHGGAVVNVSSVSGIKPAPMIGIYGASKAMLISITEVLSLELAPRVRVNAVAPAVVTTQFAAALYDDPVVAGLWKPGAGWTNLGTLYPTPCDQDIASAWDISADGTVVDQQGGAGALAPIAIHI